MMQPEEIARYLRQAGEKSLADRVEAYGKLSGQRAELIEVLDVDGGEMIPAVRYLPRRWSGESETRRRILPLAPGGWKACRKPHIRLSDSLQHSAGSDSKQMLFRAMSCVLASGAEDPAAGAPPFRRWFTALLVWRECASRDRRYLYRYMLSGYTGVFSDAEQTVRWNSYVRGPVPWDERGDASAMRLRIPDAAIVRSEDEALEYAEALISGWSASFAVLCRRASPAQYFGSSQIVVDWRDALDGVNRKWPEHVTLAEMMA